MGKEKKHKRHKSDRREKYEDLPGGRASSSSSGSGLRLVLKVGLTPDSEPSPATPPPSVVAPLRLSMAAITEAAESHRKEKKHKKKKKKDKERDREHREKHRLKKERRLAEAAYATCTEDSTSRLSSSTEPFSQSTASSPEPASVPPPAPPVEPEQWRPPEPPRDPSPSPVNAPQAYEGGDGDGPDAMEEEGDMQGCQEGGQVEEEDDAGESLSGDVSTRRDERDHGDGDGGDRDYEDEHDSHRRDRDHKHRRDRHDRHRASYGDDYEESPAHQESSRDYDSSRQYDESYEHRSHSRHHESHPSHDEPQPKLQYDPAVAEAAANADAYAAENAHEEPVKTSLQRFLEYLLRGLEKRDTQRFFRAPVTDLLAPGYSNVIRHPMDFSTMREKVHANMYSTVAEFQSDFRLMCTNAMAYNRPDTIYFKAGKKLLHVGTKMLSPEKLMTLRTVVPAMLELSPEVLGFEVLPPPLPADAAPHGTHVSSQNFSRFIFKRPYVRLAPLPTGELHGGLYSAPEPVDEDAEAEEILKQVQEAARKAAEKVAKSKNAPQLGYLRRQADGSTTMAVLTPATPASTPASAEDDDDDEEEDEEKEHPDKQFSHGVMVGRLSYGSPYMASFRDDRRSRAKTTPGTPGAKPTTPSSTAGSSFGPWYDPKFSSVTKEEADLLAQTYGGETAQQYASSVRRFTEDCQLATRMVDNLLDILTDGRHRRARYRLDQHRHVAGEERAVNFALATAVPPAAAPPVPNVDLGQLRTLSELGIDVRFVDALEEEERRYREAQVRLQHTSEMLLSLSEMQRRRLNGHPEIGGPPPPPTQSETELAETLAGNLTWMARQVPPGDAAGAKRTLASGPTAASPDNPGSHEEVDVEAVSSTATPEVVR